MSGHANSKKLHPRRSSRRSKSKKLHSWTKPKPVTREITIETRQKPKPWFNHVQKLWEILSWRSLFVTWVGSTPQALQADLTNSFRSGGDGINASLLPHNCHSLRRGLRITKGCQGNDPNMWHGSDFVSIFSTLDHHDVMEYGSGHELVDGFLLPESSKWVPSTCRASSTGRQRCEPFRTKCHLNHYRKYRFPKCATLDINTCL